jgi:hypothetical protein
MASEHVLFQKEKTMKPLMTTLLVITLTASAPAHAESATCGMATLEDVDVATALVPLGTVTTGRSKPGKPGIRDWHVYTSPGTRVSKSYLVTVRLNDIVYTAESSGDGFWTFNPRTLVVNDGIHVCVVKNRLRITRPDGKDYTAKIVRDVRDASSSNASAQ